MQSQPATLLNSVLPLALLALAGFLVPRLLLPSQTRSLAVLAAILAASVPVLALFGVAIFAAVYALGGANVAGAFAEAPAATLLYLARSSALGALVWVPFLLLAGISLGIRIEALRNDDVVRQGR